MAAKRRSKKQQEAVRPGLLYAGAALLVAVLAFAVVNFVFLGGGGGGDEEPATSPPAAGSRAPGAQGPPPAPTAAPQHPTAEQIGLFEGRDPFLPVSGAVPPPPTPAPTPVATPTPTVAPPPAAQTSGDVFVEVLSVAEDQSSATIKIGDTVHENAKPRDVLSQDFVVDRIDANCVDLHRGSDPAFRICEGERQLR